ncbi:hypothetical protein EC973_003705 [Apophysomyces ossiformis]|uniref:Heterokaryon incompatibility domain-containing protein n=1 Tax=Apophysomyces ossiformis TaxID=679940 RepID=A0A8H7BGW0_9FUNG|nr:hypothetical protein EC973_003705 [Apophysomyces ossiformis]
MVSPPQPITKSEIVLLDTESDFSDIKCISVPFDENVPQYYAISYRWGVHSLWEAQTPNYMASITSISQGNLIKLCKLWRSHIRYIWIDVVCINQADKEHRKMAIKNMDKIYEKAEKIIAVPDLCYCTEYPMMEEVEEDHIKSVVNALSPKESAQNPQGNRQADRKDVHFIRSSKGALFIREVIKEWACRCWVVSERTIGVEYNKMDIIVLRANSEIAYRRWEYELGIHWDISFSESVLIETILNCKSTKCIDRLFAILPHSKYRDSVDRLLNQDLTIDNIMDLKMVLFNILDIDGQVMLLQDHILHQDHLVNSHLVPHGLPSYTSGEQFRRLSLISPESEYSCVIQTAIHDGKSALEISGFYVEPVDRGLRRKCQEMLGTDIESVVDIQLAVEKDSNIHRLLRCAGADGVWVADSIISAAAIPMEDYETGTFIII